jgi:hypothetical protein
MRNYYCNFQFCAGYGEDARIHWPRAVLYHSTWPTGVKGGAC